LRFDIMAHELRRELRKCAVIRIAGFDADREDALGHAGLPTASSKMLTDERPCRFPHWRVAPPAKARVPSCGTFSRPGCKPFHMRRAGNLPHLPEIPLESHPY